MFSFSSFISQCNFSASSDYHVCNTDWRESYLIDAMGLILAGCLPCLFEAQHVLCAVKVLEVMPLGVCLADRLLPQTRIGFILSVCLPVTDSLLLLLYSGQVWKTWLWHAFSRGSPYQKKQLLEGYFPPKYDLSSQLWWRRNRI